MRLRLMVLTLFFTLSSFFFEYNKMYCDGACTISGNQYDKLGCLDIYALTKNFGRGCYFHDHLKFDQSFGYYYFCKLLLESSGQLNFPYYSISLSKLGDVYMHYFDYPKAKQYLLTWDRCDVRYESHPQNVYNSLGMIYLEEKQLDSALYYFNKCYQISQQIGHYEWTGIAAGYIGRAYYAMGRFEEAKKYLRRSMNICRRRYLSFDYNARNYVYQANIAMQELQFARAAHLLDSSEYYFRKFGSKPDAVFMEAKTEYFYQRQVFDSAFVYLRKATLLRDSLNKIYNARIIELQEFTLLEQSKAEEFKDIITKKEYVISTLTNTWLIFTTVITLLLIGIIYRIKGFKERLKSSKVRADAVREDLEKKEIEVQELLNKIQNHVAQIRAFERFYVKNEIIPVASPEVVVPTQLHKIKILTARDWSDFKTNFNQAYPNFMNRITEQFPAITEAEIRQCCLIRLNLSNAEITGCLGVSDVAVRQTNLRLRTRLGIKTQAELVQFIFDLDVENLQNQSAELGKNNGQAL